MADADVRTLGLIPARGGSKGIPGKNLAPVCGRPLVAWTIGAACAARSLDRVVVSTDSEEIATTARELGADVLERPAELARDETPMREVVLHALEQLGRPEVLALLQPTSPLRRAQHVDEAAGLLRETGGAAAFRALEGPHPYRPG